MAQAVEILTEALGRTILFAQMPIEQGNYRVAKAAAGYDGMVDAIGAKAFRFSVCYDLRELPAQHCRKLNGVRKNMTFVSRSTLLFSLVVFLTATTPSPQPSPDAATILQRSQDAWRGLSSYQVPVTVNAHVRVSIISLPVNMTGTQYYQAPDRQALHLDNPPSFARGLGDTLSTMGTPQTWLRDYAITAPVQQPHGRHTAYVLTGTPKRSGRVKTMTMWVSATTYAIESVNFAYVNGATLQVTFSHHRGVPPYHLPRSATVTAKFPAYSGNATITYGTYQLNQPIPATAFPQQ